MDANTTATADYAADDVVNHNKLGRARLIAPAADGAWTVKWETGKYAGQERVITPAEGKTRMVERAPRPEPVAETPAEEVKAPKAKKAAKATTEEAPRWPASKAALVPSEPPTAERTHRRNPVDFPRIAQESFDMAGAWAEIVEAAEKDTTAKHVAHRIRNAILPAFAPAGAYEAKAIGNRVWIRYVGA